MNDDRTSSRYSATLAHHRATQSAPPAPPAGAVAPTSAARVDAAATQRYAASLGAAPAGGAASAPATATLVAGAARYPASLAARPPAPGPRATQSAPPAPAAQPPDSEIAPAAAGRYANSLAKMRTATAQPEEQTDPAAARYGASLGAKQVVPPAPLDLAAPEGFDATDPTFTEFKQVAGELGLDADKGKRLLALHQKTLEAADAAREAEVARWRAATTADPELVAGAGAARDLVARLGGRELMEVLDETGLGDHPALVRFAVRAAAALKQRGAR